MTVAPALITAPHADLSMLAGTWRNTHAQSSGIVQLIAENDDGELWLRAFGAPGGRLIAWPRVPATVFFERNDAGMEQPFVARWSHGFMTVAAHGFLRQGVLVLLTFTRFDDGSARSSYFSKEFFFRE